MDIRVLGYNGPYPCAGGACSGYLLSEGRDRVLMDCGPGVLSRLIAMLDPARLTAVLLSHGHGDHCSDMMAFRYYMDIRIAQSGVKPMDVYAPKDDASPTLQFLAESESIRMHWVQAGDTLQTGSLSIQCGPARHPVPAVGFRLGSFGYTGDTNTLPELADFYRGMKVLLADGCFLKSQWKESSPHMAAINAAELARDAGAGRLIVTHLRPDVDETALLKEAAAVFPETVLIKDNMLIQVDTGK
jgi:ribonuclease BN (tRNA processing enzyme)